MLEGIDAAAAAGLAPIKINMVVKRGVNERGIVPMARHFRGTGHIVRFIEYMDVGATNGWRMDDVVPAAEIVAHDRRASFRSSRSDPNYAGEVAERWRYRDGGGEIGVIASVTQPFCGDCTRARLSAEGKLYTCLFAEHGYDLRALAARRQRATRASPTRSRPSGAGATTATPRSGTANTARRRKVEMSYIGG